MLKQLNISLKFASTLIITIILTLGFSISLQSLLAAWTAPNSNPPSNNINTLFVGDLGVSGGAAIVGDISLDKNINHATNIPFYVDSDDSLQLRINKDGGSGNFGINNSGNNRMFTVLDNGNVGIGMTGPTSLLHIQKSWGSEAIPMMYLKNTNDGDVLYVENTALSTQSDKTLADFRNGVGSVMYLRGDGNVGIGTTNPAYKLQVAGDVGATTFYYTSDKNLKKDIMPIENSLDKINNLNGVSFKWRENDQSSIGFIAQDVEKIIPELVNTDKVSGTKSVQYGNITALTVEAIKEQQKEISSLKEENQLLNERLKKLESLLK